MKRERIQRTASEMAMIAGIAILLGLGHYFFSGSPLPLFRSFQVETVPPFSEVDADMVEQLRRDPVTVVVDARPTALFGRGHIPEALSLPVSEFASGFASLRERILAGRTVIVYCSGLSCTDSLQLAANLFRSGCRNILVFRGGMEEWQRGNHELER